MNTSSHILMGEFLHQYLEEHHKIQLEWKSFLRGNILPDYCPSFLLRPHFLKNNAVHVQSILRLLLSRHLSASNDKRYSRLLGIICHFYADFFCYAHSDAFPGSLSDHIAYENKLCCYFEENLERLRSIDFFPQEAAVMGAGDVYRQFESLHKSYLLSRQSLGNDILYAMTACVDMIVAVYGYTEAEKEDSYSLDHLEAI